MYSVVEYTGDSRSLRLEARLPNGEVAHKQERVCNKWQSVVLRLSDG